MENAESSPQGLRLDVGLIYLSREVQVPSGDGKLGTRLPAGFYALRAANTRNNPAVHDPGITILELFASSGSSIVEFPGPTLSPSNERRLTASLDVDPPQAQRIVLSSTGAQAEGVPCHGWPDLRFGCELCVVCEQEE